MKAISNRTRKPIRVSLGGGRYLHLGPSKTGQISDRASELPAVQRLVKAGEVEIVGEGAQPQAAAGKTAFGQEATHGHIPTTVVRPKGDR